MRKVIVSLFVALVVGVGGYFGVVYWAQHAAAREVDAMLDSWGASVGSAKRGRIELDLWTRTLKIYDVVVQPSTGRHTRIAIGQVVASGLDASGKAARIDIVDLEISDVLPGQPSIELHQKAPRVALAGFAARPLTPRKVASALDAARMWLEQFSAITAARIEFPSLTVVLTEDNSRHSAPPYTQYTFTNLILRDVRDGRVAEATTDGIALRGNVGAPYHVLAGEIGQSSLLDADVAPLLAFLAPSPSKAQGYQRVYRQLSMGPYSLRMGLEARTGLSMRLDRLVAEDIGLHPGKLSLDDLLFLSEVTGPAGIGSPGQMPVQPGQLMMLMDKIAGLYEGVSLGKLEMQGLSAVSDRDRLKMASLRIERLENGRLGAISFDGLDAKPAYGDPLRFDRIALKGFDVAGFMRLLSTQLAAPPGQPPSLDQLAGLPNLLQGFEIKGIVVPDPRTGREGRIDASVTASGQLVGSLPTDVRASFRLSLPIGAPAPEPLIDMLAVAGLSTLAAEADLGVRWSEAAETLALEPATLQVGGVVSLSAKASINKATRELFSTDIIKSINGALAVELGPIEVTLRDLGVVDVLAAEAARFSGRRPEEGRGLLLEQWTREAQAQTQLHPGAQPFYDAVGRFLRGKGETLTVRLTPKGIVRVLELIEAFRLSPPEGALLAAFIVEASSSSAK